MKLMPHDRTFGPITLAILLILAAAGPGAANEQKLTSLVDRHLDWLGGESAWRDVETLELRGVLRAVGLEGPMEFKLQREPVALHFEYDLGVVTGFELITSGGAWTRNQSGQIEAMGAASEGRQRRQIAMAFQLPFLDEEGGSLSYGGSEERDGVTYEIIRLSYPNGDVSDVLIHPSDGSNRWTRSTVDLKTHWVEAVEWKTYDGVRIPTETREIHENSAEDVGISWTAVLINPHFPATLFDPPASQAKTLFADGSNSTGWTEMELMAGRWIFLRGTVAGYETDIVLDSGAGITVIDKSFADRIGLVGAGAIPARGVGGEREATIVQGVDLRIGSAQLPAVTAAIIDLEEVRQMLGRPMPVILGKEMFHQFVVDIDYPKERIAFHSPEKYTYDGGGAEIALIPSDDGHKGLHVSVEDGPEVLVKLDTGSGGTLTLFESYTNEAKLLEGRSPLSDQLTGGVGGQVVSGRGTLRRLSIAGFELQSVPVGFHTEDRGSFHTAEAAGNLGSLVLGRFRNTYDYSRERLFLEPGEDWDRAFEKDRLGASLQRIGEVIEIVHVGRGSPAEEAGLKVGDQVVAADGTPLAEEFRQAWSVATRRPAGTVMTIHNADGKQTKVVLRDFY